MIRTTAVRMSLIGGLAYKQKLASGGAGITIMTPEDKAVYTINKRDGSCVPYGQVNTGVFTPVIVDEALELTRGLPYKRLGKITKVFTGERFDESAVELEAEDTKVEIDIIASVEYKEFIAQYTDKNDKFSFQLMNKSLIQFASRSSVVKSMITEKTKADIIAKYIVKSKAAYLARNKGMNDDMLNAFIDTFDSMETRSAFKELNAYLRGRLSKSRRE